LDLESCLFLPSFILTLKRRHFWTKALITMDGRGGPRQYPDKLREELKKEGLPFVAQALGVEDDLVPGLGLLAIEKETPKKPVERKEEMIHPQLAQTPKLPLISIPVVAEGDTVGKKFLASALKQAERIGAKNAEASRNLPKPAYLYGQSEYFPAENLRPRPKDEGKLTCDGKSFNTLKRQQISQERRHHNHFEYLKMQANGWEMQHTSFIVVKMTFLINDPERGIYLPCEVAATAFTIHDGIIDNFSSPIDIYNIPLGCGCEGRGNLAKVKLPEPPFEYRFRNYRVIVERLEKFVEANTRPACPSHRIYIVDDEGWATSRGLNYLYAQIGALNPFDIYSFEEAMLVFSYTAVERRSVQENLAIALSHHHLSPQFASGVASVYSQHQSLRSQKSMLALFRGVSRPMWSHIESGRWVDKRQIRLWLDFSQFTYLPQLSCPYHSGFCSAVGSQDYDDIDDFRACALNELNRWVYSIMDVFIHLCKVRNTRIGRHVPGIKENNGVAREFARRKEMIAKWCLMVSHEDLFQARANLLPPYYKKPVVRKFHPVDPWG